MLVINSIEKTRLSADSFSYSGSGVAWKARLVLFLGFALMAGGLAGSVTVMVLKYLVRDESEGEGASFMTLWLGIANVVANALVMLRYVSTLKISMVVLIAVPARLCFGFRRIWRMIIPTTWHYDYFEARQRVAHSSSERGPGSKLSLGVLATDMVNTTSPTILMSFSRSHSIHFPGHAEGVAVVTITDTAHITTL
jgi:hypothetical protein